MLGLNIRQVKYFDKTTMHCLFGPAIELWWVKPCESSVKTHNAQVEVVSLVLARNSKLNIKVRLLEVTFADGVGPSRQCMGKADHSRADEAALSHDLHHHHDPSPSPTAALQVDPQALSKLRLHLFDICRIQLGCLNLTADRQCRLRNLMNTILRPGGFCRRVNHRNIVHTYSPHTLARNADGRQC